MRSIGRCGDCSWTRTTSMFAQNLSSPRRSERLAAYAFLFENLVSLFLAWRYWYRRPAARKTSLWMTAVLAFGVVVVLIRGNHPADPAVSPAITTPTTSPPGVTPVRGTAS